MSGLELVESMCGLSELVVPDSSLDFSVIVYFHRCSAGFDQQSHLVKH